MFLLKPYLLSSHISKIVFIVRDFLRKINIERWKIPIYSFKDLTICFSYAIINKKEIWVNSKQRPAYYSRMEVLWQKIL